MDENLELPTYKLQLVKNYILRQVRINITPWASTDSWYDHRNTFEGCWVSIIPGNKKKHIDVSKNRGTPKSSILIGFSIINHPFWGTPIFGNTHINITTPFFPNYQTPRFGIPGFREAFHRTVFLSIRPGALRVGWKTRCRGPEPGVTDMWLFTCLAPNNAELGDFFFAARKWWWKHHGER